LVPDTNQLITNMRIVCFQL